MPDVYRQCASVVLLRPSAVCHRDGCGTVYEVLLVHKPRKRDAWQLPQGGVEEGETIAEAAQRELKEEANVDADILGQSTATYKYDFPPSYRRFRPDSVCGQNIQYVFARAHGDSKVEVDEHEIDSYAWVMPERLQQYLKRKEYRSLVGKLVEEGIAVLESAT